MCIGRDFFFVTLKYKKEYSKAYFYESQSLNANSFNYIILVKVFLNEVLKWHVCAYWY